MEKLFEGKITRIQTIVNQAIKMLNEGAKKVNLSTSTGNTLVEVTGYWVGEMMRIDIKL